MTKIKGIKKGSLYSRGIDLNLMVLTRVLSEIDIKLSVHASKQREDS